MAIQPPKGKNVVMGAIPRLYSEDEDKLRDLINNLTTLLESSDVTLRKVTRIEVFFNDPETQTFRIHREIDGSAHFTMTTRRMTDAPQGDEKT